MAACVIHSLTTINPAKGLICTNVSPLDNPAEQFRLRVQQNRPLSTDAIGYNLPTATDTWTPGRLIDEQLFLMPFHPKYERPTHPEDRKLVRRNYKVPITLGKVLAPDAYAECITPLIFSSLTALYGNVLYVGKKPYATSHPKNQSVGFVMAAACKLWVDTHGTVRVNAKLSDGNVIEALPLKSVQLLKQLQQKTGTLTTNTQIGACIIRFGLGHPVERQVNGKNTSCCPILVSNIIVL